MTRDRIRRPLAVKVVLIFSILAFLLFGCAEEIPESITPILSATPRPTRTLRPAPTITPTPSLTPTATLRPYPDTISPENLSRLALLYRFNSLGLYHPENDWLVLYDNQQTAVWDLRSAAVLNTFIGRYKASQGDYLLTSTGIDLLLWNISTGKQLLDFPAQQGQFHPTQPWLIVFDSKSGYAELWDYQSGEQLEKFIEYEQDYFAFSPDGELLAASGGAEMLIRVWSLADLELEHEFSQHVMVYNTNTRVEFSAGGEYLLVGGSEEQKIFDLQAGEMIWVDSDAWAIYPGPDLNQAMVITEGTTHIYDLEARRYLNDYLLGDTPTFFESHGLITNHTANLAGHNLYIYQADDFSQLASLTIPQGFTGSGTFLPEANLFAVADQAGGLNFYDLNEWEALYRLDIEDFYIVRPEFSAGGHWLLFSWYTYDEFGDYYSGFDIWGIP